ncbi:MAG: AAA family ATPase [Myxococcaceae bacterium]
MDRLLNVDIRNFRSIASLTVTVEGLQVLVGENGGGKSSILECFELLRRATAPQFTQELERVHGGARAMVRSGESVVTLEATIQLQPSRELVSYKISFGGQPGWGSALFFESLSLLNDQPVLLIERALGHATGNAHRDPTLNAPDSQTETALPFSRANSIVDRVWRVLDGIEVHLGHEVTALWRQRERSRSGLSGASSASLRDPSQLGPAKRLEHGATNLASLFHGLKNDTGPTDWDITRRLVRLGLGEEVDDVAVQVVADSGFATLALRYVDGRVVPAMALSDGQLAYLAFVAMTRAPAPRSVLLIDEPELHLHPGLAVRVLDLLDAAGSKSPVILSTHSNDILDALEHPEDEVRIVSQVEGKTLMNQLTPGFLERWKPRTLSELRRSIGDAELRGDS